MTSPTVLPDYAPVAETAAGPVIDKYTGVLGAVDVFTVPTAFTILESIRLDLGYRMDVHQ